MSKDYGKARFATGGSKFDELSPDDKKKAIEAIRSGEAAKFSLLNQVYTGYAGTHVSTNQAEFKPD